MFTGFNSCYPAEAILAETAGLVGCGQFSDPPVSLNYPVQVLTPVQERDASPDWWIFRQPVLHYPFSATLPLFEGSDVKPA